MVVKLEGRKIKAYITHGGDDFIHPVPRPLWTQSAQEKSSRRVQVIVL